MAKIRFEWDEARSFANQRKHGISFEQAIEAFDDPLHMQVLERNENGEERWQTFGLIQNVFLLTVAHTVIEEWDDETLVEVFRIISARYAVPWERRLYGFKNR